jgi:hypothetical protein
VEFRHGVGAGALKIVECQVPSGDMLSREMIERACFHDFCSVPMSRGDFGIVDIFFGNFGHHPL